MKETIRSIVHQDGERIVLLVNEKLSADFPPEVARQLAMVLLSQAALIDNEKRQRENVVDQAILMRAGANIGLTASKKTIDEAFKEAQWNTELRKYMKPPESIASKEAFGLPTINNLGIKK